MIRCASRLDFLVQRMIDRDTGERERENCSVFSKYKTKNISIFHKIK